jgi:phage shock protein A
VAEHRRAKIVGKATKARQIVGTGQEQTIGRMRSKVHVKSAENAAASEILSPETLEEKFKSLESEDKVELLLQELKSKAAAHQLRDGSL